MGIKNFMNKVKQNQGAMWVGLIYAVAVLLFSIFSVGDAVLTVILSFGVIANILFSVLLIPIFIFIFVINFVAGFYAVKLIGKLLK